MQSIVIRISALLCVVVTLTGCDQPLREANFGSVTGVATSADYRVITERGRVADGTGKVVCTEPSPDIAKAYSTAFSASVSKGTTDLGVQVQEAEALAQLGKRYATVQLLRDIIYRDCEDYANGAIDKVEYAFRLSRFGDLVVTLLGIEMVSGDSASAPVQISSPTLQISTNPGGKQVANSPSGGDSTGDKPTGSGDPGGASDSTKTALSSAKDAIKASDAAVSKTDKDVKALAPVSDTDKSITKSLQSAVKVLDSASKAVDDAGKSASGTDTAKTASAIAAAKKATDGLSSNADVKAATTGAPSSQTVAIVTARKDVTDAASKLVASARALADIDTSGGAKQNKLDQGNSATLAATKISDQQAKTIQAMQHEFLQNANFVPVIIACSTVMQEVVPNSARDSAKEKPDHVGSAFADYCANNVLPRMFISNRYTVTSNPSNDTQYKAHVNEPGQLSEQSGEPMNVLDILRSPQH